MFRIIAAPVALAAAFYLFSGGTGVEVQAGDDAATVANPAATPKCTPCRRPDTNAENKPADVVDFSLDKVQIIAPCADAPNSPREMSVQVTVGAEDPENDVLVYLYTVSGGRIVGTGQKVIWDLNKAAPGTYTITAGVDDGCGICGKTATQTVTVIACPTDLE